MAPEPVPRSTTTDRSAPPAAGSAAQLGQGDLDDLLGLRPRDEHPPVDHEVQVPEPPAPEHVLQRLPGRPPVHQLREVGRGPGAGRLGQAERPATRACACSTMRRASIGEPERSTAARRTAGARATGLSPVPRSWRARSSAARASTRSSSSPMQDLVELVQGEADAVVGDPVLLVVVGPDLLGPAAPADLAAARSG